jgi:hypothetical protein
MRNLNMRNLNKKWCDDFEDMDFSEKPVFMDELSKLVDKYVVEMCKFPMEFVPENHCKRLDIFVKISRDD